MRTGLLAEMEEAWADVQKEKQVDVVYPVPPFSLHLSLWSVSALLLCPWLI